MVVVTEPFFSGPFESHEVYQKTYGLVSALNSAQVPVVAPWEGPQGRGGLMEVLAVESVPTRSVLAAELRVVVLSGHTQVAGVRDGEVRAHVQAQRKGRVELVVRAGHGEVVWEMSREYAEDMLSAELSGVDAHPALGRAIDEVAATLVRTLRQTWPQRAAASSPSALQVRFDHQPMFTLSAPGSAPLVKHLDALSGVEATVEMMKYYQYFDREIDLDELEILGQRRGGLWVVDPGALAQQGLAPDDFVVAVGGVRALGPQVLARQWLQDEPQEVVLLVERQGRSVRLVVQL